jgi:hypothetical protein
MCSRRMSVGGADASGLKKSKKTGLVRRIGLV